jgi:hypothetical protein
MVRLGLAYATTSAAALLSARRVQTSVTVHIKHWKQNRPLAQKVGCLYCCTNVPFLHSGEVLLDSVPGTLPVYIVNY